MTRSFDPSSASALGDDGGDTPSVQNARCIQRLYAALQDRDAPAATACYAEAALFEDIGFRLTGREAIGRMWDMVCSAEGFRAEFDPAAIKADDNAGQGFWIAHYPPLMAGSGHAEVRNASSSSFRFATPGVISNHRDDCDLEVWAAMAFAYPVSALMVNVGLVRRVMARAKLAIHTLRKT